MKLTYEARNALYLALSDWLAINTQNGLSDNEDEAFSNFFDEVIEQYTTGDYSNYN